MCLSLYLCRWTRHLLNRELFQCYFNAGQPDGLLFHIFNSNTKKILSNWKGAVCCPVQACQISAICYCQHVIVESDHKPLDSLLDKPIANCSTRIQRMRLQLQMLDLNLVYKPGSEPSIVDTLSRPPSPRVFDDDVAAECKDWKDWSWVHVFSNGFLFIISFRVLYLLIILYGKSSRLFTRTWVVKICTTKIINWVLTNVCNGDQYLDWWTLWFLGMPCPC